MIAASGEVDDFEGNFVPKRDHRYLQQDYHYEKMFNTDYNMLNDRSELD